MITKFDSLFAGHIDLDDDIGYGGVPVNERRYGNERLVTVFDKAQAMAQLLDRLGYQQADVLGEADGRIGPRAQMVGPVEVPVAEPAQDLGRVGGLRGRRDGLGVLEHVDAVGRLDLEPGHPPDTPQLALPAYTTGSDL